MDSIDREILSKLEKNCRISYQNIACDIGISSNAVKKRVSKLLESGVLEGFSVMLSRAMAGSEVVFFFVRTDGSLDDEAFIKEIGSNSMVYAIMPLSIGDYIVMADCIGTKAQLDLGRILRTRRGVVDVDMHPILSDKGRKAEISRLQLRVLKCLLQDARMSTVGISRCSGLTTKRVRRILMDLEESKAIDFTINLNINTGESLAFLAVIKWDASVVGYAEIDGQLRTYYPHSYWFPFVCTIEPLLYGVFIVQKISDVEDVYRSLKSITGIMNVKPLVFFPNRLFKSIRVDILEETISKAGI
ncbi:MAG: Lrp/AsnC family transcriptional regulator [Candidatus Thorarchaeota archaeon]|nr:Lrp/AsnC family transcriptional regulator [Candidatus Thorarchaeota archaeon]